MNGCTPGKRRRGWTGGDLPGARVGAGVGVGAGGSCLGRWVTGRTWCAAHRKPLFLRRRAPRLPGQRRRRRAKRGASLPANPYSFVTEHHVFRGQGTGGGPNVVRRSPQTLIPSSPSTTSSGAKTPAARRAAPRYKTTCIGPRDGGPVQVVFFIIPIPTQRHRCTAGSRCPSGR